MVDFRPSGVFYCPQYPAQARYQVLGQQVQIEWGNFGQYVFGPAEDGTWNGNKLNEPHNWRKLSFLGSFTAEEQLLMGAGGGSCWGFQWEKGEFEIELRCDGYNHFVCKEYPAHSHWLSTTLPDGRCKVDINWGQYGEYELILDAASQSMVGNKKGQPANWRKAYLKGPLGMDALSSVPAHDHSHRHEHGETCNHPH